jgi:Nuclease A inhibitor-like protein
VVIPTPEAPCDCRLTSTLSLTEFTKQLIAAAKDLLYPSESDFPIEVLSKGVNTRMPTIKGIEVRTLDRVFPSFLRQVDPDDQQTGNVEQANTAARWQALYSLIEKHTVTTAWHYPVKQKRYTHEILVILLHPQGAIGLRIKLVET